VAVTNPTGASTTMTVTGEGSLCPVFEKKTTKVPSLVGVSESDIEATLNAAGLYLGTMSYGASAVEPGLVFSQDPKAGTTVEEGTTVNVTISQAEEQGPIYVDVDARGKNNGLSWTDAFTALQDGLTAANTHRNHIHVAEGFYKPDLGVGHTLGDREASFQLKNGVTIKGGFAGFGKPNPDARDIGRYETVLSGNIGDPAETADNSLHVVMAVKCDATTVLDGLTIAGGNADDADSPDNRGAGLFNNPASLKVIDCTFRDNAASWFGAGMYNNPGGKSEPNLIRCTFRDNTVGSNGAAVYSHSTCNPTFTNCLFQANTASAGSGGAMTIYLGSATLTDCNFIDNQAKVGAAVYASQANTTMVNCTFRGNCATDNGGAVKDDKGVATLTDCTFTENSATRGGAMHFSNSSQSKLTGCVFVGNTVSVHGGAIYCDTATTTLAGCTFLDNLAATNGGAMWIYKSDDWVVNCTFGGNSAKFAGGVGVHLSESELTGCVFSGNVATTDGGGLGVTNCTRPTYVANCTFSRNSATNRGGGLYDANSVATVSNTILWANTAPQGPQITLATAARMTVQRCDVQDGQAKAYVVASTLTWGTGNVTSDPRFADADGPDNKAGTAYDRLDLSSGSSCIDTGDNTQVPTDAADVDADGNTTERLPLDVAGRPRFVDDVATANTGVADPPAYPAIVDIGAYEYKGTR
jgi:predicted outer membrane repeat protein